MPAPAPNESTGCRIGMVSAFVKNFDYALKLRHPSTRFSYCYCNVIRAVPLSAFFHGDTLLIDYTL